MRKCKCPSYILLYIKVEKLEQYTNFFAVYPGQLVQGVGLPIFLETGLQMVNLSQHQEYLLSAVDLH